MGYEELYNKKVDECRELKMALELACEQLTIAESCGTSQCPPSFNCKECVSEDKINRFTNYFTEQAKEKGE